MVRKIAKCNFCKGWFSDAMMTPADGCCIWCKPHAEKARLLQALKDAVARKDYAAIAEIDRKFWALDGQIPPLGD